MAWCNNCMGLFPPDFMEEVGKEPDKLCVFCRIGKDYITMDGHTGRKKYTRKECIEDYRVFLRMLEDNPRISRSIVNKGVKELKGD